MSEIFNDYLRNEKGVHLYKVRLNWLMEDEIRYFYSILDTAKSFGDWLDQNGMPWAEIERIK